MDERALALDELGGKTYIMIRGDFEAGERRRVKIMFLVTAPRGDLPSGLGLEISKHS